MASIRSNNKEEQQINIRKQSKQIDLTYDAAAASRNEADSQTLLDTWIAIGSYDSEPLR